MQKRTKRDGSIKELIGFILLIFGIDILD